jgi:hypothetical protein
VEERVDRRDDDTCLDGQNFDTDQRDACERVDDNSFVEDAIQYFSET